MEAWMKDVILPLLIAVLAAVVGSGSLVLCGFLCNLLVKWWQRSARGSALRARASPATDADSSEQPLPRADALHDIEMGTMSTGEVANLPNSSSPDDDTAGEE